MQHSVAPSTICVISAWHLPKVLIRKKVRPSLLRRQHHENAGNARNARNAKMVCQKLWTWVREGMQECKNEKTKEDK